MMEGQPIGELSLQEEATMAAGDFLAPADWVGDPLVDCEEHRYRGVAVEGGYVRVTQVRRKGGEIVDYTSVQFDSADPRDRNGEGYETHWSPTGGFNEAAVEHAIALLAKVHDEAG